MGRSGDEVNDDVVVLNEMLRIDFSEIYEDQNLNILIARVFHALFCR